MIKPTIPEVRELMVTIVRRDYSLPRPGWSAPPGEGIALQTDCD